MKFREFFWEYSFFYLFSFFLLLFFLLLFAHLNVSLPFLLFFFFTYFGFDVFFLFFHYYKRKRFYDSFFKQLQGLDQKYFITEMEIVSDFLEAKKMMEALYEIDKSMRERLVSLEEKNNAFKEFIELWIHEVKVPLSNFMLLIHNKELEEGKLMEQFLHLDSLIEQVLFYVRSETIEKDYLIHSCSLKEIVHKVIQKNKDAFILQHISLEVFVEDEVLTDCKWMEFILNQILSNSLKYKKKKFSKIRIVSDDYPDFIVLRIWDNGIGISSDDLPRVFEKSFTGENGRMISSSTGMGLYIVHNLIHKLGHSISISSSLNHFTEVKIIFYKNDFYNVL